MSDNILSFKSEPQNKMKPFGADPLDEYWEDRDDVYIWLGTRSDMVNSPAHYTRGNTEAIDIIEDAIQDAPSVKAGMLQAQVLKYMLRLWLKDSTKQDAEKARWYLNRLIDSLD